MIFTPAVDPLPDEPPKEKSLKEMAAAHREAALQALADILAPESKASPMAKVAAANSLLDRSDGKAVQYVEQTTKLVTYQDLLDDVKANEEKYKVIVEAQSIKQLPPPPELIPLSLSSPTPELVAGYGWGDV